MINNINGEYINQIRKLKHIKISDFEKRGFSKSSYYRFVNNSQTLSLIDFFKVLDILKITYDEFKAYSSEKDIVTDVKNETIVDKPDYEHFYELYKENYDFYYLIKYFEAYTYKYLQENPTCDKKNPIFYPLEDSNEVFHRTLQSGIVNDFEIQIINLALINGIIDSKKSFNEVAEKLINSFGNKNVNEAFNPWSSIRGKSEEQIGLLNLFNKSLEFESFELALTLLQLMTSYDFDVNDYASLVVKKWGETINLILDGKADQAHIIHINIVNVFKTVYSTEQYNSVFENKSLINPNLIEVDFSKLLEKLEPLINFKNSSK